MDRQQWQDFLTERGAVWEGDEAHFPDTDAELLLIDLSPLGAVAIKGPDSQKFLQGQLTCDLVNLPDHHASAGAHCNPKGRMISAFNALKLAQDDLVLSLPRDLAPLAQAGLGKYAVFFKTELSDISDQYHWLGLQGRKATQRAAELLALEHFDSGAVQPFDCGGERALAFAVSEEQVAILLPRQQALELWQQLERSADAASYCHWLAHQIAAGIPQLHASTSEQFIPQMLNLHLLGGVSFKKGCYTGQEVVARIQYLGAAKRRLYRARCASGAVPAPAAEIRSSEGKNVGDVVIAERSGSGIELLAVLSNASVAGGEILTLDDGRSLELLDLPYDADADPLA